MDFLENIEDSFDMSRDRIENYPILALAYIGDDVYDLIVRSIIVKTKKTNVKNLHRAVIKIVNAKAQAMVMKAIEPELTEAEHGVYRRGRNAKSATSAKNATITDYRIATGLEAVFGYLYLTHNHKRAIELIKSGLKKTNLIQWEEQSEK